MVLAGAGGVGRRRIASALVLRRARQEEDVGGQRTLQGGAESHVFGAVLPVAGMPHVSRELDGDRGLCGALLLLHGESRPS